MDLDAYSAAHRDAWDRLDRLGRKRRFTGVEADELIGGYQTGATQLSALKTTAGSTPHGDRLSLWLSRARLRFTGVPANVLSRVPRFFAAQLPAALYRVRWTTLAVMVASVLIAVVYALWAVNDPRVLTASGASYEQLRTYATEDFVTYYSQYSGGSFTSYVWTNNAQIAAQAIAFGIVGVYTPYVLFTNASNLGTTAAIMAEFGRLGDFFLYIAPHGQLELYVVFVAGATGLRIFWAWIAPGTRTRAQSLAQEGRALFTIVVGLVLALLVAGLIEGFMTGRDLPWPVKVGTGTVALLGFVVYQWVVGRRAARRGETGDLDEFESGAKQLVAG